MLNPARILIIAASLFVAGLLDAGASIPKTRVGNFLETALVLTAPKSVQVLDTRLENWSLYDEPASGSTLWTNFDPDGLKRVEKNRTSRKSVNNPGKAPKRKDFEKGKEGRAAYDKAKANHADAEKTAKDNSDWNTNHETAIKAWENYDKIQGMTASSKAMNDMNSSLDQEKVTVGGKEYNLIVNITMTGMTGKNGDVSPGHIEGDSYVINMDLSTSHFANPSVTSDRANNGQVPWHTLPHETYHAVEAAGIGTSGGMRGTDPLGLGTTRPGDGSGIRIPGTKLPVHEARATRAGNIVADQTGHTTFSTSYPSTVPGASGMSVPGYAP